jgi:hypothetical protein
MTLSKKKINERHSRTDEHPLNADWFYRLSDRPKYFGYGLSVIPDKIEVGEIPPLVSLSDSGRGKGWFGRTILRWQAEREAKADEKAAARKAAPARAKS